MTMIRRAGLGVLMVLFCAGAGRAQEPWQWELTGRIGTFRTSEDIGPATPVSQVHFLDIREIDAAISLGLQADLTLPVEGLALSLRGMTTLPTGVEGGLNCLPGFSCLALMLPRDSEVRSWTGTVGLLYRPWSGTQLIRPFLTAGVGLKQERYSWQKQENGFLPGKDRSVSSGAVLAGVGFDLRAGPFPLRLEVADIWTPEGDRMKGSAGPHFSSAWPPRRNSRHNLNFSVGVFLPLH